MIGFHIEAGMIDLVLVGQVFKPAFSFIHLPMTYGSADTEVDAYDEK